MTARRTLLPRQENCGAAKQLAEFMQGGRTRHNHPRSYQRGTVLAMNADFSLRSLHFQFREFRADLLRCRLTVFLAVTSPQGDIVRL